jgi:conjugal transfer pilus assembly protein TraE
MRLAWLQSDLDTARRTLSLLLVALACSLLVNTVLAFATARLISRERVILVPPTIQKSFWVESDRVSNDYLAQMAYFLMQLTLNVTPVSIEHQGKVLLQYASPASFGELRTALMTTAQRLKRDGASTFFSVQDMRVDERRLRVGVRGQLATFISDRRVSDVSKGYAIELEYVNGRIFLKAFRETNPHDPLETQPRPVAALADAH